MKVLDCVGSEAVSREKPRLTGRVEMNGGSGFCRGLLFWASEERGFDADGAEHVIGENRKRHFGCSSFEVSGEEPAATHHPLDRAERILGGTATPAHHLGAGALVHPVERILVKVAGNRAARRHGALRLQRAA